MLCAVIAFTVVRRRAAAAEVRDAAQRLEEERSTRPAPASVGAQP
jgi:hypothetical protein